MIQNVTNVIKSADAPDSALPFTFQMAFPK